MRLSEIDHPKKGTKELFELAVSSSWIEDLSYDPETEIVTMTLLNGRVYNISNVPEDMYEEWIDAFSKGKFWHSDVKFR